MRIIFGIIFTLGIFLTPFLYADASDLTPNLVAYYPFDGNSTDVFGGNNGTPTNITYATGLINQDAVFNGASSYISVGNISAFDFTNSFSSSVWVKTVDTGLDTVFMKNDESSFTTIGYILYLNGGTISFHVGNNVGDPQLNVVANYNDGNWHNIVVTYNSGAAVMYMDGTQIGTGTLSSVAGTNSDPFVFGTRSDGFGPDRWLNGSLDEVGFWNVALTSSQVTELYNGGVGFAYPFGSSTPPLPTLSIPNYFQASSTCSTIGSSTPSGSGFSEYATTTCFGYLPLLGAEASSAVYVNSDTTYGDFTQWFMWIIFFLSIPTWQFFFSLWKKRGRYDKITRI